MMPRSLNIPNTIWNIGSRYKIIYLITLTRKINVKATVTYQSELARKRHIGSFGAKLGKFRVLQYSKMYRNLDNWNPLSYRSIKKDQWKIKKLFQFYQRFELSGIRVIRNSSYQRFELSGVRAIRGSSYRGSSYQESHCSLHLP